MDKYLFKVSLMATNAWSRYWGKRVPPVYFVGTTKAEAKEWAVNNLKDGLSVRSVSCMARQLAPAIFTGDIKLP